jgi:hypothetical protein
LSRVLQALLWTSLEPCGSGQTGDQLELTPLIPLSFQERGTDVPPFAGGVEIHPSKIVHSSTRDKMTCLSTDYLTAKL